MVLTSFGLPHTMGYLATLSGERPRVPVSPVDLMDEAVAMGLAGVELPPGPPDEVDALACSARERGLRIVPACSGILDITAAEFAAHLHASARLGSSTVRATLSGVLCGDRRPVTGGWPSHMNALARRLRELLPVAAGLGISIAVENHQDATSEDLLRLHEASGSSPAFGVTLDTGNPLAVGEGPLEFARRVQPLIRHIHLKDYTIHFAPEGYRLVRCAAGQGVVPFAEILALAAGQPSLLPGIEIAAQPTRTIPLLDPGWWECYPEHHPARLREALAVLWKHGRPKEEPFSSAWERGDDSETVVREEWALVRQSVEYFRALALQRAGV